MRDHAVHLRLDENNNLHDNFCRCRGCKPPLVGEVSQSLLRIQVAAAVGAVLTLALIVVRIGGAA